ncbi:MULTISPECIES: hypothetical protein [unclassified Thioalkalivibrio]|uniref:hypothetical protein n=1 Tax=unclassified Thioalkalivibrio TaxID=2621013 RepID=UPI000361679B|nr:MULTISPECIES: hypothetical protein [unclassified Thioalkalivibrio]
MIRALCLVAFLGVLAAPAAAAEPLQDPTKPPRATATGAAAGEAPGEAARVSVIRLHGSAALAVVGDQTVRVGDRLNGAHVQDIDAGGVTLEQDDRTWTLPLGSRPDMQIRRHP